MGKYLQIRVSAWTYDEDEIRAAWPGLATLAWGEGYRASPLPGNRHGVTELVETLDSGLAFADWPEDVKKRLGPGVEKTTTLKARLENALADWDPREADRLSYELEDTLTDLENLAPRP